MSNARGRRACRRPRRREPVPEAHSARALRSAARRARPVWRGSDGRGESGSPGGCSPLELGASGAAMPRGLGARRCGAAAAALWAASAAAATAGLGGGFWVRPAEQNVAGLAADKEGLWGGAPGGLESGKWDAAGGLVAASAALAWTSFLLSAYAWLRLRWRGRLLKAALLSLCYLASILGLTATCVFNTWVRDSGAGGEGISDTSGGGASLGWSYWCFFAAWVMWLTLLPLPLCGIEVPAPTPEEAARARRRARLALSKSARRHKAYESKGPLKTWRDDSTEEEEEDAAEGSGSAASTTAATTTRQGARAHAHKRRVVPSVSKGPLRWWRSSSSISTGDADA